MFATADSKAEQMYSQAPYFLCLMSCFWGGIVHILLLYLFCFVLRCGVELPLLDEQERVPSPARPLKIPARARENPRPSYLYFSSVSHECRFVQSWVCIAVPISVLSSCANFRTCSVNLDVGKWILNALCVCYIQICTHSFYCKKICSYVRFESLHLNLQICTYKSSEIGAYQILIYPLYLLVESSALLYRSMNFLNWCMYIFGCQSIRECL